MRRFGFGARRIAATLDRVAAYLRSVQLASGIQRCAYRHEREDPATGRRHVGAPCGGRLKREGRLLTCQQCGRTATG